MKKTTIIFLILLMLIAFNLTLTTEAKTKTNKIKIKATEQTKTNIHYGINNGKPYAKINGFKISSNKSIKYLKIVNIGF